MLPGLPVVSASLPKPALPCPRLCLLSPCFCVPSTCHVPPLRLLFVFIMTDSPFPLKQSHLGHMPLGEAFSGGPAAWRPAMSACAPPRQSQIAASEGAGCNNQRKQRSRKNLVARLLKQVPPRRVAQTSSHCVNTFRRVVGPDHRLGAGFGDACDSRCLGFCA